MERTTAERVERVYRALHPYRPSGRGSASWFRRELHDRAEIDVSAVTIHRWLIDGVPVDRLPIVEDVLAALEEKARGRLEAQIGGLGP